MHRRLFCWDNFTSKNCSWGRHFLIYKTGLYGIQPSTLLNFITDDVLRLCWNSCSENFGNLSEKHMKLSSLLIELLKYSLKPTTVLYYRNLMEVLRKKRMFQNFENSKKTLCEKLLFSNSTALKSRISEFSKYKEKYVLWVFCYDWMFAR